MITYLINSTINNGVALTLIILAIFIIIAIIGGNIQ